MLDIKLVRSDPDLVKAGIRKRDMDLDAVVDEILDIDVRRRQLAGKVEGRKPSRTPIPKKSPKSKRRAVTPPP